MAELDEGDRMQGFPPRATDKLQQMEGLLLGGAVGDALGAPVEFMRRDEILARFGPDGITGFAPAYGRLGAITDDTQMTLFTLEGLIRADVRWSLKGIRCPWAVVGHAYHRWLATQNGDREALDVNDQPFDGWLIKRPELWSQRAPGNTCLTAMRTKAHFADKATNESKGSGGIMRVGPIGVVDAREPYELGKACAALTHGHTTGQVAAGWFAYWIHFITKGQDLFHAAFRARAMNLGEAPELDHMLRVAMTMIESRRDGPVPAELGEGWVAEEAAAIALWCSAVAKSPIEAILLAVNIDGDSDTTGSLVGQVMGAAYGTSWIPEQMLAQLELRDAMQALARDADVLFNQRLDLHGPEGNEFCDRYPGW